jgi:hypothetical protein
VSRRLGTTQRAASAGDACRIGMASGAMCSRKSGCFIHAGGAAIFDTTDSLSCMTSRWGSSIPGTCCSGRALRSPRAAALLACSAARATCLNSPQVVGMGITARCDAYPHAVSSDCASPTLAMENRPQVARAGVPCAAPSTRSRNWPRSTVAPHPAGPSHGQAGAAAVPIPR